MGDNGVTSGPGVLFFIMGQIFDPMPFIGHLSISHEISHPIAGGWGDLTEKNSHDVTDVMTSSAAIL